MRHNHNREMSVRCDKTGFDASYTCVNAKSISPADAPPGQVAVYACPLGQVASADLTHCSHRPLVMEMVEPATVGVRANLASPD